MALLHAIACSVLITMAAADDAAADGYYATVSHTSVMTYTGDIANVTAFAPAVVKRQSRPGKGCYFLVFVPTSGEIRDFYREMYRTNRESADINRRSAEVPDGARHCRRRRSAVDRDVVLGRIRRRRPDDWAHLCLTGSGEIESEYIQE
eukprot:SAG31_NODE_662_length_13028_cov_3.364529_14_plen_149_part_00